MIRSFIIGSLAIVLTSIAPAQAQTIDEPAYNLTPRNLINLGRQGKFKAQGVPSHARFISAIRSGKVDAQILVSSAITNNRLPQSAISDRDYLNAVNDHLKSGGCSIN
ncbi:hypothetical protein Xen7305DRAFT_00011520 [Xenococcus sp. PCC 7305]|uniref:hypothetical protein n=1 Tax=Xenococcus sp. PCC 7305 TaxID=102125 RepID=UPI0002AC63EE|nr:hypothetical protein [Xenococcus sp. PCC 7305]ELS01448.1 hypothetical protein Xen7305DRAFT_00011520 [Xenococcus sp. PCC 7305]